MTSAVSHLFLIKQFHLELLIPCLLDNSISLDIISVKSHHTVMWDNTLATFIPIIQTVPNKSIHTIHLALKKWHFHPDELIIHRYHCISFFCLYTQFLLAIFNCSNDFLAIVRIPSRVSWPPQNPVAWTNTHPGKPMKSDNSWSLKPRHASGSGSLK